MARAGDTLTDIENRIRELRTEVQRLTEGTVWVSGGCASYYIDRNGHNSTIWPTFTWPFRQRTREFDEGAYALGAPAPAPVPASA